MQSFYQARVSNLAGQEASATVALTTASSNVSQLTQQRDSVNRRSPTDTEMVNMMKYQQAYTASAKVVQAMNDMLGDADQRSDVQQLTSPIIPLFSGKVSERARSQGTMRVTDSLQTSTLLNNVQTSLSNYNTIQQQLSTGKKLNHLSDRPDRRVAVEGAARGAGR